MYEHVSRLKADTDDPRKAVHHGVVMATLRVGSLEPRLPILLNLRDLSFDKA